MKTEVQFPETLQEAIKYFADEDRAFEFMKCVRFPGGHVSCPRCASTEVSFISTRKLWTCKKCTTKKQFTLRVGTILEDSPIPYDKWICAFWLIANSKNGISSYEIGRSLGVTQRTGWFMLQRIRLAMQNGSIVKFKGEVEVDETYIGGKARFMHKDAKARKLKGGKGSAGKEIVQGLLERDGRVRLLHVRNSAKNSLDANVRANVETGSKVYTDAHSSYVDLWPDFHHKFVDHAVEYVNGKVHTNGLENFWSLLKRGLKGTYVSVEPFHLFRYLDEQAFRFNERKDSDMGRFLKAIAGMVGKRLTYAGLTGEDRDGLPQTA